MSLDPIAFKPYADPDDFIREVTDLIWIQRDVSHIVQNYEPDSIVHFGLGTIETREEVIAATLMGIATTPQHVGQAEDVVWEARGVDAFLSSHMTLSSDPEVVEGRPSRIRYRTVANCLYRRGRMVEEWVVRDELAKVLQRRQDPDEVARASVFTGWTGSMAKAPPGQVLLVGDSGPRPQDQPDDHREASEAVLAMIESVWNQHRLDDVHQYFDRDLFLHTVGDVTITRPAGYQEEMLRMTSPFPGGQFAVRDLQVHEAARYAGIRVAVLWELTGRYDGVAAFGSLTRAPVQLLGVSHFLVQDGRIVREVRVYDEIALRAQISASRGDLALTGAALR